MGGHSSEVGQLIFGSDEFIGEKGLCDWRACHKKVTTMFPPSSFSNIIIISRIDSGFLVS